MPMESEEEIKNRIDYLDKEIQRGWLLYGRFLDTNMTLLPDAVEVREIIRKMTEEKAKLVFMDTSDITNYINKHRGQDDTTGQQVLPLPKG
jgi:hypothetical protein